jgi:hypothetical protein
MSAMPADVLRHRGVAGYDAGYCAAVRDLPVNWGRVDVKSARRVRRWLVPWVALVAGLAVAGVGLTRAATVRALPDIGGVPSTQLAPSIAGAAGRGSPPARGVAAVPVRLRVPSLGVDAPVTPVAAQSGGALAVPDDPHVVGWWRAGAAPGSERGTVVLDGHVDSHLAGPGALFRLAEIRPGAAVLLMTSRGTIPYVVVAIRGYPKADLPAQVFDTSGRPRLVLITCGGAFDRRIRQYADNIVAYGVPAGS